MIYNHERDMVYMPINIRHTIINNLGFHITFISQLRCIHLLQSKIQSYNLFEDFEKCK